jgi:oligoribonuclease NrnB/cAMP/cGMP phosphodiesterase (DHH superfamily)
MSTHCFYHKADFDGLCSGAIVKYYIPETILHPFDYGENFPIDSIKESDTVYLVDISVSEGIMEYLNKTVKEFYYIDHHISKMKSLKNMQIKGLQEDGVAACKLAWKWFTASYINIPVAVELINNYDIWNLSDEVLEFQYGLRVHKDQLSNPGNKMWEELFCMNKDDKLYHNIINSGKIIKTYESVSDKGLVTSAAFNTEINLNGNGKFKVLALNALYKGSKVFQNHPYHGTVDIYMVFGFDGMKWKVSMYSDDNGPDVSQICASFGGGGHAHAAGFTCPTLPELIRQVLPL